MKDSERAAKAAFGRRIWGSTAGSVSSASEFQDTIGVQHDEVATIHLWILCHSIILE